MKKSFISFIFLFFMVSFVFAQTPYPTPTPPQQPTYKAINYQGLLKDHGANANGIYDVRFRIFTHPEAPLGFGETCGDPGSYCIWEELHEDITITRGLFNLEIGSISQFDFDFDRDLYLEVQVMTPDCVSPDCEPPMTPRQRFNYTARSFFAEMSLNSKRAEFADFAANANYAEYAGYAGNVSEVHYIEAAGVATFAAQATHAYESDVAYSINYDRVLVVAQTTPGVSIGSNYPTIQDAIQAVPSSTTEKYLILVKPGTYTEDINITADPAILVLPANVDLIGESRESVIIKPAANKALISLNNNSLISNITLEIAGNTENCRNALIIGDNISQDNITIKNIEIIQDSDHEGIKVGIRNASPERGIFIENTKIFGGKTGITCSPTNVSGGNINIYNCELEGQTNTSRGKAIFFESFMGSITIKNCTINKINTDVNACTAIEIEGIGTGTDTQHSVILTNNIFRNDGNATLYTGIKLIDSINNYTIQDNYFKNFTAAAIELEDVDGQGLITSNRFVGNALAITCEESNPLISYNLMDSGIFYLGVLRIGNISNNIIKNGNIEIQVNYLTNSLSNEILNNTVYGNIIFTRDANVHLINNILNDYSASAGVEGNLTFNDQALSGTIIKGNSIANDYTNSSDTLTAQVLFNDIKGNASFDDIASGTIIKGNVIDGILSAASDIGISGSDNEIYIVDNKIGQVNFAPTTGVDIFQGVKIKNNIILGDFASNDVYGLMSENTISGNLAIDSFYVDFLNNYVVGTVTITDDLGSATISPQISGNTFGSSFSYSAGSQTYGIIENNSFYGDFTLGTTAANADSNDVFKNNIIDGKVTLFGGGSASCKIINNTWLNTLGGVIAIQFGQSGDDGDFEGQVIGNNMQGNSIQLYGDSLNATFKNNEFNNLIITVLSTSSIYSGNKFNDLTITGNCITNKFLNNKFNDFTINGTNRDELIQGNELNNIIFTGASYTGSGAVGSKIKNNTLNNFTATAANAIYQIDGNYINTITVGSGVLSTKVNITGNTINGGVTLAGYSPNGGYSTITGNSFSRTSIDITGAEHYVTINGNSAVNNITISTIGENFGTNIFQRAMVLNNMIEGSVTVNSSAVNNVISNNVIGSSLTISSTGCTNHNNIDFQGNSL